MRKTREEVKELAEEVVGDFYGNQFMALAGAKLYMNLLYTLGFDGGFPHCYSHDLWKIDTKEHVSEYDVRDFPVHIDINEYEDISPILNKTDDVKSKTISTVPNETDDVKSKILSVIGKYYPDDDPYVELLGAIIWNDYIFTLYKNTYGTWYHSYELATGKRFDDPYKRYPRSPIKIFEGEFKDISHMKFNTRHLKKVGIIS